MTTFQGLGLLVLFFAIILQMGFGFSGPHQGKRGRLYVFVIFLCVLLHLLYLTTLSTPFIQTELFVFTGVELCFAIAMMIFFLFSHFNFSFDKMIYENEIGLIEIVTAFLALCVIFSNHFLVLVITIPTLMLIVFSAPHFSYKSLARLSLMTGVPWAMLFLVVLGLSSAILFQEFQSLNFSEIQLKIVEKGINGPQILGVLGPLILFATMMIFASFGFFLPDYERSDSWNLIGYFRLQLPLLGVIMIGRWVLTFGGVWRDGYFIPVGGFPLQTVPLIVFLALVVSVLIQTLMVRKLSQLLQVLALQPLLLTLWALSTGNYDSLLKGIAGLFLYALAVPLCLKVFVILDIKPFEAIAGGRMALRGASFVEKLQICTLLVLLSPLGTYIGYSLTVTTMSPVFQVGKGNILSVICAASLLFSVITVLGELFDNHIPRKSVLPRHLWFDHVFGNTLLILLITLGIYPSPLYKYVSYILSHSMR